MANMSTTKEKYEESSEKNGEFDLPQHILEQYDSDQQVQLIRGYRILQVLKYYPNNEPFFEKPENVLRGSKHYYDIIKSPMYLDEIKRKFFNAEYNSLFEVIKDMRLIFENCYYFWGPKSTVTEQCLQMERLMESQMLLLPKDLKSGCTLEETHGKNEDDVVTKVWNRCRNKGKTCSRLLLRTWRKRRISETKEYSSQSDLSKVCKNSKQIMRWERDVLFLPDILSFISSALELPQIGLFFQLVQSEFELTPICQTEVERIVIMPQYSSSFREIFSALFSENHSKDSLSYDEITEKIKQYVTEWYNLFNKNNKDAIEVSKITGLQKNFFDFVGTDNPLLCEKYEQLPYCKKVIILKSVCDHLTHTRSSLKELLQSADESKFSPRKIGKDKYGYTYLFFPTFLDFRLYKQKIKANGNSSKDNSQTESEDTDYRTASLKRFLPSASTDFEIVADSTEGIRCLIDELFYADLENSKKDSKNSNTDILEALQEVEWDINSRETDYIRWMNETRVKLFNEWRENCESSEPILEDETTYNNLQRDLQIESDALEAARSAKVMNHSGGDQDEDGDSDGGGNEAEDEREDDENTSKRNDCPQKKQIIDKTIAESAVDSFTEEMESFIKSEPTEIEENFSDYEIKPEVKEEFHSDSHSESSVSTRRRRSSVPSYSVFNEDFFSDSNEFESPEDDFTSTEDSDEEWEIPSKRARNKSKMKGGRSNVPPPVIERPRRKCRSVSSTAPTARSEDDSEPSSTTTADFVPTIKEEIGDEEIKTERIESGDTKSAIETASVATNASKKAASPTAKPMPKLKVIDLARLKSADSTSNHVGLRVNRAAPPDASAFMIQTSPPSYNSLPMIRACMSQRSMNNAVSSSAANNNVMPPRMMIRQSSASAVFSNAYVVPRMQNTFVMTSVRRPATPLNSATASAMGVRGPPTIMRTLAPTSLVNANPNMFRHTIVNKQLVRVPIFNNAAHYRPRSANNANVMSMATQQQQQQQQQQPQPTMMMMRKQVPAAGYDANHFRSIAPMTKMMGGNSVGGGVAMKPTTQRRPSVREIEGTIGIHSNNGNLRFVVYLANGSQVPLSNEQVQKLRDGNGGALPPKLKIPVPVDVAEKIEPCVVLDE